MGGRKITEAKLNR
ncbi:hypothetical protein Mgra_00004040 [Meloidogyne graminicola]|uniref:Uncharacterized protein n=1 Tax=Meloidogyne graminicola TaxID=189291 RepID=A0A8S9ZTJ1_9BILA|nr:hypothetical protein Mgra_00004040 [Meloidogyne graminicola]